MASLVGSWKLTTSENFDEFMKHLGVNFLTRKVGNTTKPTVTWSVDGDQWTFKTSSTFKSQELKFKLGETIDEETLDGRKVKVSFERAFDLAKIKHHFLLIT